MEKHRITIVTEQPQCDSPYIDGSIFSLEYVAGPDELAAGLDDYSDGAIVLDFWPDLSEGEYATLGRSTLDIGRQHALPVIVMSRQATLEQKLVAMETGFNDVISVDEPIDEITTRLLREIYHNIADRQLKQQLSHASDAALAAMRESSNLGSNVHFLVQSHQCANLDELGQLFFQSMNNYGLHCSLQMRSAFEVKNMEGNGMARQLESELLGQLKDAGRYFDFGRRSVVNYGTVSVLIRNMPEDEILYGLVKDNTFTLLQGLDARVRSLDGQAQLEKEKNALKRLSTRLNLAMHGVNDEYQVVMRGIVDVVENMAEKIADRIPTLLLNEDQEVFIEESIRECVFKSNQIFTEGFKVDNHFAALQTEIEHVIEQVEESEQLFESGLVTADAENDAIHDIELF